MSFGSWESLQVSGLAANRPTTANPPIGVFVEYFATDTGVTSRWYYGATEWEDTDAIASSPAAAATGVTATFNQAAPMRHIRVTLDAVAVAVAEADDFGSAELLTWPDKNILVAGCEVDLTLVKAGTTNGIVAATDLDVALGTSAASNATLASGMVNILPKQDVDTDSLSVALQAHSLAASPVLTPILDGATNKLYLNVACSITADDSLTATGTIDIFYWDLGNVTS